MNILFFTQSYLPNIGGVEKHIFHLSEELVKDGNKITIVTLKNNSSIKSFEKDGNISIYRLGKIPNKYINRLKLYIELIIKIRRFGKYDVIHFHDFSIMNFFLPLFYFQIKISKKKFFITFHGWEGDFPPSDRSIKIRKRCEKLVNGNICIGGFISKWYGTRPDVILYGGVTVKNIDETREDFVFFGGRFERDTGVLIFLNAWKKISEKYLELNFILCGDGSMCKEIKEEIGKNKIKNINVIQSSGNTDFYLKNALVVFATGYLSILDAFSYKKKVISVYDNELKKDYLQMMPSAEKMMWIFAGSDEIAEKFSEVLANKDKQNEAFNYSLDNSWINVKNNYYKIWKKIEK